MKLALSDIIHGRKKQLSIEDSITIEKNFNHGIDSIEPIAIKGKVYYLDNALSIHLSYKGMVHFVCDRCLKVFDYILEGEINQRLSTRDEFDVEWLIIRDEKIDLTEAVTDDILIHLPIQLLCSDDCQGLCSKCGIDLNQQQCSCLDDDIDPRLESLKKFFN